MAARQSKNKSMTFKSSKCQGLKTKSVKVTERKTSLPVEAVSKPNGIQGAKMATRKRSLQTDLPGRRLGSGKKVLPQIKKMTERFDDMISGCLDNLPTKTPTEVRIFLSSTFSDMRAERNALAKQSYPAIKEYCSNSLDLDFQVVDLRWGINTQATNTHVTEKICLIEIENCQKVSLGPNFVGVLSHRYGYRSIPSEIKHAEFEVIMNEVKTLAIDNEDKLKRWYLKDENNIPAMWILQPINTLVPDFGSDDIDRGKQAELVWKSECKFLQNILRQGVKSAMKKDLLSQTVGHKYFRSVTEEEIEKGLMEAQNPGSHIVCFIRRLIGLNQNQLSEKNATRYIDTVISDGVLTVDEEVKKLISAVQDKKIINKLPKANIHLYEVTWQEGGITGETHPDHQLYIDALCKEFTSDVIRLIEAEKHRKDNQIPVSEYYTDFDELLHHLHFCKTKCENFKGCGDILGSVQKYMADKKNHKPLIIHAESGAGKTSVMAMIMKCLPKWFGAECVRLIRFLGTSPECTDIFDVLFSVMGQLADDFDMILEPVGYKNIKSLVKYLPRFLRNVSRASKQHVFILLDSIDQLGPSDDAYSMSWLPKELPSNIHIILSMLPETHGCLDRTRSALNKDKNSFLELKALPLETGAEIIDEYLRKHKRKVSDKGVILNDLKKDPKPLFLKLVLDQAVEWRSYDTEHRSLHNVRHAIETLFSDIEKKCGQTATRAVIGYLTHGLNGLTEVELEDVLSLDDDVLDSVFVFHDPPIDGIIHVPSIVLKRILYLLREYIVERRSQNKKTLYWYHRQFVEYALDYVKNDRVKLHTKLAQLYMAEGSIQQSIRLKSRKKTLVDVDRQITVQPLTARNKRKLQALPYHLKNAGDLNELKTRCLCNLHFMMCKMKAFSLNILIRDYSVDTTASGVDPEISLVLKCLQDMKDTVSAGTLALELLARLPEARDTMANISNLLASCRKELRSGHLVSLMPIYPCLGSLSQHLPAANNIETAVTESSDRPPAKNNILSDADKRRDRGDLDPSHLSEDTNVLSTLLCVDELQLWTLDTDCRLRIWDLPSCRLSHVKTVVSTESRLESGELTGRVYKDPSQTSCYVIFLDKSNELISCCTNGSDAKHGPVSETHKKASAYFLDISNPDLLMSTLYILVENSADTYTLDVCKWPFSKEQSISIQIKDTLIGSDIHIKPTHNNRYLFIVIKCTDKDLEAIKQSLTKNHLKHHGGANRLYAVDLVNRRQELAVCYRQLTKIPTVFHSWQLYSDDLVVLGFGRITVMWDAGTGSCDQRMIKGTKTAMVYRPAWIESDGDASRICHGQTMCMSLSDKSDLLAVGSEDGFVLAYSVPRGHSIVGNINKKPNHGNIVEHIAVSADDTWIVSYCCKKILKLWHVKDNMKERCSIQLGLSLTGLFFSSMSKYLLLHGITVTGEMKAFLFEVLPPTSA